MRSENTYVLCAVGILTCGSLFALRISALRKVNTDLVVEFSLLATLAVTCALVAALSKLLGDSCSASQKVVTTTFLVMSTCCLTALMLLSPYASGYAFLLVVAPSLSTHMAPGMHSTWRRITWVVAIIASVVNLATITDDGTRGGMVCAIASTLAFIWADLTTNSTMPKTASLGTLNCDDNTCVRGYPVELSDETASNPEEKKISEPSGIVLCPLISVDPNEHHDDLSTPPSSTDHPLSLVSLVAETTRRSRVRAEINSPNKLLSPKMERTTNWKRGALIGHGAFGTVYIALNSDTGEMMAVKALRFDETDKHLNSKLRMVQNEIQLLKSLEHENIVRYFFVERSGNEMDIFMEYVPGGSLLSLVQQFGALSEMVVVQYTHQILKGLEYLHRNRVVHRDIKGANILITVDGFVKLADFGSATVAEERMRQGCEMHGTPVWMAPEVVRGEPVDTAADIWSLGCTVMEMVTGQPPWAHLNKTPLGVMSYIAGEEPIVLPPDMPLTVTEFVDRCLQRDPVRRPSATALLEDHFFYDSDGGAEIGVRFKSFHLSSSDSSTGSPAHANESAAQFRDILNFLQSSTRSPRSGRSSS